jgi:glycolate oxidase FAD binding subunit
MSAGSDPRVVQPESTEEVAHILREATAAGQRVRVGRGSLAGWPDRDPPDLVISADRLTRVGIYEPADLTGEFGAGITGGGLRELTQPNGQWLPLDPWNWQAASLGGLVAMGRGGLVEPLYGAPRDLVLGLTLVTGDGRILELGGRVVKNVAGFDLVRLAVGSRGVLGVITRISIRFFPLPESDRLVEVRGAAPADLEEAERSVQSSMLPLAGVITGTRPGSEPVLRVRLQGNREPVAAQERELLDDLGPQRASSGPWVGDDPSGPNGGDGIHLQIRTRPSRLAEVRSRALDELGPWGPETDSHVLTGRLDVRLGSADDTEAFGRAVSSLRSEVEMLRGSLVLDRGPAAVLAQVGAMGGAGPGGGLMARLKAQLDPGGTLGPGPFSLEDS